MRTNKYLLVFALAAAPPALTAEQHALDVRVTQIIDGDTIEAIDSNRLKHRIRLAGIDAPEKDQAFGDRSRQNLAKLLAGKVVRIEWTVQDRYGRFVAIVWLPTPEVCERPMCIDGRLDVNLTQVVDGFAWHFKEYEQEQNRSDRLIYSSAEQSARVSQTGLWRDPDPTPPWNFRRGLKDGPVKKSRNDICHEPGMSMYGSVKNFESFATLAECLASGGRLPVGRNDR
jgi:endonuclease YncB( thermonuclease family)